MSDAHVVIATAAVVATTHALIPDHWLPYVLAGKARGMPSSRVVGMAAAGAIAHLFSTVIVGLVFVLAGNAVAANVSEGLDRLIGLVVTGLGLYLLWRGFVRREHPHEQRECHHGKGDTHRSHCAPRLVGSDYTLGAILGARPCAEAVPIFLASSTRGVFSSLAAIATWIVVTLVSMVGIVWLSTRGLETARFAWLDRNSDIISGAIITVVGILTLL